MNEKNYSKVPVFENGLAQPVFPLTDGKTGEKYDPATSSIVRYCVYVETDYDVDEMEKRSCESCCPGTKKCSRGEL